MGSEDNRDRAYQHKIGCSIMASNSISDHFDSSGWDQSENIGNEFINPHYSSVIDHQKVAHIPSNSGLVDLLPSFGSGSLSEMVSSFVIPRVDSPRNCHNSENGDLGVSINGNRKRKLSGGVSSKNVEVEQHKQGNAEPAKDYIHVRAKKGQATNSHSLAERVRREKISERMKLLQEIVPGCDKITGKAVMLDEIINYVQSLQQQVEFLSMKLATVNPELDVDIDQILSKDIINSRVNATALGLGPGLSSLHPKFHPLTQNSWNNELQSILQTGFDSNSSIRRFGAKWTVKNGAIEFCSEN